MLGPLKNSLLCFLTLNKENGVTLFLKLTFHLKKYKILLQIKHQTSEIHPQLQVVQLAHILQWDYWLLQNTKTKGKERIQLIVFKKFLRRLSKEFEVLVELASFPWFQNFTRKKKISLTFLLQLNYK